MKYIKPQIGIRSFSSEIIRADNNITASADTYSYWSSQQGNKVLVEKRLVELNEIVKYEF